MKRKRRRFGRLGTVREVLGLAELDCLRLRRAMGYRRVHEARLREARGCVSTGREGVHVDQQ